MVHDTGIEKSNLVKAIHGSEYLEQLKDAANQISEVMKQHCGPMANSAAWPAAAAANHMTDTNFTKDGVDIVRRLHFDKDSLHDHVAFTAGYIGTRVDEKAGDGTTTAILLFTRMLAEGVDGLGDREDNPRIYEKAFSGIIAQLKARISKDTLTIADLAEHLGIDETEIRKKIAYRQAMIASKNDHQLSDAISRMAAEIPIEKTLGDQPIGHYAHESDTHIDVQVDDYQFRYKAEGLAEPLYATDRLKRQFDAPIADILPYTTGMVAGNPIHDLLYADLQLLRDHLRKEVTERRVAHRNERSEQAEVEVEELSEKEKDILEKDLPPIADYLTRGYQGHPLIILTLVKGGVVEKVLPEINTLLSHTTKYKGIGQIHILSAAGQVTGMSELYLQAIQVLAGGIPNVIDVPDNIYAAMVKGVSVTYRWGTNYLDIRGLYPVEEGQAYVPYYNNRDTLYSQNPHYYHLVDGIKEAIDDALSRHDLESSASANVTILSDIYRQMVFAKKCRLMLGGRTHELREALAVAKDAYGSVATSFEKGFIFDGIGRMRDEADKLCSQTLDEPDNVQHRVAAMVSASLWFVTEAVHRNAHTEEADQPADLDPGRFYETPFSFEIVDIESDMGVAVTRKVYDLGPSDWERPMLIQPAEGYYEILTRLEETVPKYLTTMTYIASSS